jgi:hypothetical protein
VPNLTGDPNQAVNVTMRALEPTDQAIPDLWNVPFQQLLNNDANLNQRVGTLENNQGGTTLSAHRTASVLDHPDGSVTTPKLADGAVTLAKLASAILGQPNGLPLLNSAGALAASDGYLSRGSVTSAVDWNTLTAAGVYEIASGAFGTGSANTPPAVTQQGHLLVFKTSAATTQVYVPAADDPGIYWRQYARGAWSPWATAGVMYGSNSNGSYIRFADGTQICWAKQTSAQWSARTQSSASVGGITVYLKDITGVTFPAAFTTEPAIVLGGDVAGSQLKGFIAYNPSSTNFNITASYLISGSPIFSYYIAIGRWK